MRVTPEGEVSTITISPPVEALGNATQDASTGDFIVASMDWIRGYGQLLRIDGSLRE
ncbi:MAG TPA: hypothetical protein VM243_19920 [Phycisphaerae bacterium]|nr:hypothetical protein [Phycisphaerae bacterium]